MITSGKQRLLKAAPGGGLKLHPHLWMRLWLGGLGQGGERDRAGSATATPEEKPLEVFPPPADTAPFSSGDPWGLYGILPRCVLQKKGKNEREVAGSVLVFVVRCC